MHLLFEGAAWSIGLSESGWGWGWGWGGVAGVGWGGRAGIEWWPDLSTLKGGKAVSVRIDLNLKKQKRFFTYCFSVSI